MFFFAPSLFRRPCKDKGLFQIHLTGADLYQWALAEDYKQTLQSIDNIACAGGLAAAGIVHAVYWEALRNLSPAQLVGKVVICNLSGAWERYETDFGKPFLDVVEKVDLWVVRSRAAEEGLKKRGLPVFFIPYTVDEKVFKPLPQQEIAGWRRTLKIPDEAYVIGNFMRDSSGGDLTQPKAVKGPDIFAAIVEALHRKGHPVHVLLAGPRRHWIRSALEKSGIPYSYVGYKVGFDDMRLNTLKRPKLNKLYNMLDLSIVSSRSEAGPHAILEAAASRTPQISTKVGIAADILPPAQLYESVEEAVALIEADITEKTLARGVDDIYRLVLGGHVAFAVAPLYRALYQSVSKEPAA